MISVHRWFLPRALSVLFLLPLLIVAISIPAQAIDWSPIGPDTLSVNDYCSVNFWEMPDALFTDDGAYLGFGEEWYRIDDGVNLPAVAGYYVGDDSLLILYGDGSFSDGIYLYTHDTGQSEVLDWAVWPHFIHRTTTGWYVGHGQGLKMSTDLETWVDVDPFNLQNVTAMASQGDYYAVCAEGGWSTGVFTSDDAGTSWTGPSQEGLRFTSILVSYEGPWYATYGGDSRSSGLYESSDHGLTWTVAFYSLSMIDVHLGMYDPVIAWDGEFGDTTGVQLYHSPTTELVSMNENLPCLNVNRLSQNDMIDCVNVVACTDSGAYMTCEFPEVNVEPKPTHPKKMSLSIHPNPFNAAAVIEVYLPTSGEMRLILYSVDGRRVADLYNGSVRSGQSRFTLDGQSLGVGMYFLVLEGGNSRTVQKVVLLK